MKNFVFFKEVDSKDSGTTCLRMIAKYYCRNVSLQSLREKTQIGNGDDKLTAIPYSTNTTKEVYVSKRGIKKIHWYFTNDLHFLLKKLRSFIVH